MKYLDLTLATPEQNLACDEALLDWCEAGQEPGGILRFWEPEQCFVVLGYANAVSREVNLEVCRELRIPILRRCTGGGTVLQSPGCLNYSLLLKIEGHLQGITETNCFIMKCHAAALTPLLRSRIAVQGFTDLAVENRKISGNAQRRRGKFLLFHGTFLLEFDPGLMERVLLPPSRQPPYRQNRSHGEFLTKCAVEASELKAALQGAWQALDRLETWPRAGTELLVKNKYSKPEWNLKQASC